MIKYCRFYLLSLLILFLFTTCTESNNHDDNTDDGTFEIFDINNPQNNGDRLFGINISEGQIGFEEAFAKAREAGIQVVELNLEWDALEVSEGVYQDPFGWLAATAYYGYEGIQVAFSLAVINTVKRTTPDYLDDYNYSSNEVITAFTNLADWLVSAVPENVTIASISIGNEVDLVLDGYAWADYINFYNSAAEYMKTNYPDIKVGVKTTVMEGFMNELNELKEINLMSDVIMLNYYPQNNAAQVLDPEIVLQHFGEITAAFEGKDIWFTELGYQSGPQYCNSSETRQARFYNSMFTAWDNYKDKVKLVIINWLHDQSPETIAEWETYYGSSDPAFLEFLSTLGLRNYDGTDKYGWIQVKAEANARGWE